jgi:uncharacterized protein (DUF342 family)
MADQKEELKRLTEEFERVKKIFEEYKRSLPVPDKSEQIESPDETSVKILASIRKREAFREGIKKGIEEVRAMKRYYRNIRDGVKQDDSCEICKKPRIQ